MGMRVDSLEHLERVIKTRYRSIKAFLVVRRGHLVYEGYFGGCGPDDAHLVASVTKSFISALIGIAINKGFLEGVHQCVLDFFPEYSSAAADYLKRKMTIEHLLTMTAGFQWRTGARNHELYLDRLRRSKDWVTFILDLPVSERSFGRFQYNSGLSHLLSVILTRCTGKSAAKFAAEHLFQPIGMDPPAPKTMHSYNQEEVFSNTTGGWPTDPQGNNTGGWGLVLKPRDMARFGFLYLNRGKWDGQQIIPTQWVEDSLIPYTPEYGYHWWLRDVSGDFVYSAVGQGGQHIFCIPERDLVVVVASKPGSRWRDRWVLLEEFILPAVVE
jgi:CubicO group peptidase (beta-lactamase class C family)